MNDITDIQYVAVIKFSEDTFLIGKIIYASDMLSAMIQFDLTDEPYTEVWLYIEDDKIYSFEDN